MSKILLMTAHGETELPNSDGSSRHSTADITGLTERLGYRPVFCTRLYSDNLMQSWLAAWMAAPRYVDVLDMFWIEDSEVIQLDTWYWTQHCLTSAIDWDDNASWSDNKEEVFNIEGVDVWKREYLVKEIPENSFKLPLNVITVGADKFFPKFFSQFKNASDDAVFAIEDMLVDLKDSLCVSLKNSGYSDSRKVPNEAWYNLFIQDSGIFTLLWSFMTRNDFVGWWLSISPETMGRSFVNAQLERERWNMSCVAGSEENFSRDDFDKLAMLFYQSLDTAANTVARDWIDRKYPNFGRNEICPCGSGKKFKKCHAAPKGFEWLCEDSLFIAESMEA